VHSVPIKIIGERKRMKAVEPINFGSAALVAFYNINHAGA